MNETGKRQHTQIRYQEKGRWYKEPTYISKKDAIISINKEYNKNQRLKSKKTTPDVMRKRQKKTNENICRNLCPKADELKTKKNSRQGIGCKRSIAITIPEIFFY